MSTTRAGRWAQGAGLLLLAFNLRPAVTSIGPLLADLRAELGVSDVYAGVLTTLPVLSFAVFGVIGPVLSRRLPGEWIAALAATLVAAGLLLRAITGSPLVFLVMSTVALAAIAVANVLMPVFVMRWFPDRVGTMTALYTTALGIGAAVAAGVSVPIAEALGWRYGLGLWGVVVLIVIPAWLWRRPDTTVRRSSYVTVPFRALLRRPLAWAMLIYFGTQSLGAYVVFGWLPDIYRSAGLSSSAAGLLLTVSTLVLIPISLIVPRLAVRRQNQRAYVVFFAACYLGGYVGLLVAPGPGAGIWAVLLGIAGGSFPLSLTMLTLRTATTAATVALSALAQSGGYLIAASGPVTVGVLHHLTRGWTAPLLFVIAIVALQLPAGLVAGRAGVIDPAPSDRHQDQATAVSRR